jgi:uncharacterized protein YuzE
MRIRYDKETDIVYISLSSIEISESDEIKPGIILDYAENGEVVGIEILKASKLMGKEKGILYELA